MGKLVVFDIGEGNFERGFPVTLRIGEDGKSHAVEFRGRFPAAVEIPKLYSEWQATYTCWGGIRRWRIMRIDIPPQVMNFSSLDECENAAEVLRDALNNWLNQPDVWKLREHIIAVLTLCEVHLKNPTPFWLTPKYPSPPAGRG